MKNSEFLKSNFGIEIEMTGVTRAQAASTIAQYLNGRITKTRDRYDTYKITAPDGRVWNIVSDGSIRTQMKDNGQKVSATSAYSVELVSPILNYERDINTVQEIVRELKSAGAFSQAQNMTGIHIHLDGEGHTPRSLRNFINLIFARNELLYKSLQIEPIRMGYCKKLDESLVTAMNKKKPQTLIEVENIWYHENGDENRNRHYNNSRYHFLNLHSFFHGVGTVELRGFNGTLHAGKIRSYIVLALAMNNQALTQKSASSKKPQTDNEKFAMRTWLNRIGLIGEEFKNCREHLCKHLGGSAAWRNPAA